MSKVEDGSASEDAVGGTPGARWRLSGRAGRRGVAGSRFDFARFSTLSA